jgi:hypothetical protein
MAEQGLLVLFEWRNHQFSAGSSRKSTIGKSKKTLKSKKAKFQIIESELIIRKIGP